MVFAAIFLSAQPAAGMDIYGDFFTSLNYGGENKGYLGPSPAGNLGTYLGGNLYFSHMDRQFYQYVLDLRLEGSLADAGEQIAPVNLRINQLFLQAPLSSYSFLYCGKKIKETGVSRFFNISNRISPKFLAGFDYQRNAPGFVEVNFIRSHQLANGFILYFRGAKDWDKVSAAAYTDFSQGNFNADGYFYYEELEDPFIGVNLSYQRGVCQFYLESIWKNRAEQFVPVGDTGNPAVDFVVRDRNSLFAVVLGASLTKDDWNFSLEYLHRQEGYDRREQKDFIDYLKAYGPEGVCYTRCALLQNYLAVSWSRGSFLHPDLTVGLSGIFSFQPVREEFSQYVSWELSGSVRYMLAQNCGITLHGRYTGGGEYGEFNNLSPEQYSVALVLSYQF